MSKKTLTLLGLCNDIYNPTKIKRHNSNVELNIWFLVEFLHKHIGAQFMMKLRQIATIDVKICIKLKKGFLHDGIWVTIL